MEFEFEAKVLLSLEIELMKYCCQGIREWEQYNKLSTHWSKLQRWNGPFFGEMEDQFCHNSRGDKTSLFAKILSAVASSAAAVIVVAVDRAYLISISLFQHK